MSLSSCLSDGGLAGETLWTNAAAGIGDSTHPATHFAVLISLYSFHCGARPGRDLGPVAQAEFGQDVLDVVLGRPLGHEQFLGDLPVRQTARHELRDLLFPAAQG